MVLLTPYFTPSDFAITADSRDERQPDMATGIHNSLVYTSVIAWLRLWLACQATTINSQSTQSRIQDVPEWEQEVIKVADNRLDPLRHLIQQQ